MSPLLLLLGAVVLASDDSTPATSAAIKGITALPQTIPGTTAPAPGRAPTPTTALHIGSDAQLVQPEGLYLLRVKVATLGKARAFRTTGALVVRCPYPYGDKLYACTSVALEAYWDESALETNGPKAGGGACPGVVVWDDGNAGTRISSDFDYDAQREGPLAYFSLTGRNKTDFPLLFTLAVHSTTNRPIANWTP